MAGITPSIKKIDDIKHQLLQPALTSHYICSIEFPVGGNFDTILSANGFSRGGIRDLLSISCTEASLPGSSLATHELNNDFTGITQKHAYRRLYDDRADFTFYVDAEYRIIDFFENWISYVVNENDLKAQEQPTYNYRVNFPNDYKTENLYITKFERDYNRKDSGKALTYKFINAYPISINSMPVSYDSSQLLKCNVSFTYSRYVISRTGNFASQNQEPSSPTSRIINQSSATQDYLNREFVSSPEGDRFFESFRNTGAGRVILNDFQSQA